MCDIYLLLDLLQTNYTFKNLHHLGGIYVNIQTGFSTMITICVISVNSNDSFLLLFASQSRYTFLNGIIGFLFSYFLKVSIIMDRTTTEEKT